IADSPERRRLFPRKNGGHRLRVVDLLPLLTSENRAAGNQARSRNLYVSQRIPRNDCFAWLKQTRVEQTGYTSPSRRTTGTSDSMYPDSGVSRSIVGTSWRTREYASANRGPGLSGLRKSSPCAAHINSIAMIISTFLTT